MTIWHDEVMPSSQQQLLARLGPFAERFGYYLAGGTAVALRLAHRQSIDFDWFAKDPVAAPGAIRRELQAAGLEFQAKSASDRLVDGTVEGIRVTFIQYEYDTVEPPEPWAQFGCRIATLDDLGCMKLWAVASRGSRKDFIDIYAMLKTGISLRDLLARYRKKFDVRDTMPVVIGLSYFDDAEKQPMPNMLIKDDWGRMKSAIQRWTREALA